MEPSCPLFIQIRLKEALTQLSHDTREFPWAELAVAAGFFLVLFIEQSVLQYQESRRGNGGGGGGGGGVFAHGHSHGVKKTENVSAPNNQEALDLNKAKGQVTIECVNMHKYFLTDHQFEGIFKDFNFFYCSFFNHLSSVFSSI